MGNKLRKQCVNCLVIDWTRLDENTFQCNNCGKTEWLGNDVLARFGVGSLEEEYKNTAAVENWKPPETAKEPEIKSVLERRSWEYYGDWNESTQKRIVERGSEVVQLLLNKNRDYGCSVFQQSPLTVVKPSVGILVRMGDKIARLSKLFKHPESQSVNENVEDTMKDLVGYAILWLIANEDEKALPDDTQG